MISLRMRAPHSTREDHKGWETRAEKNRHQFKGDDLSVITRIELLDHALSRLHISVENFTACARRTE